MASKFLSNLSKQEYDDLTDKLLEIQSNICYICQEPIDKDLQPTNIDHIIPLASRGKDSDENFAVTHESCNKSKQDANLKIARILHFLKKIQDKVNAEDNRSTSLKHILQEYNGSAFDFKFRIENHSLKYSFSEIKDNKIYEVPIFEDHLSKEKYVFLEVPLQYLFHDEIINPRGLNSSIGSLIKEFEKGNPQLHLSLARIDDNKLKIFDGQHKAVAQILLGVKKLPIRVFIEPDVDRLTETNTNAGSTLRQIAFDKSIMRMLSGTLYHETIKRYQTDHQLAEDDYSVSELQLIEYFKGVNVNIRKYITDNVKNAITHDNNNRLKDYIDFEGRAKDLPISYSAYDKTFLSMFVDYKLVLNTPLNYKIEEGLNPRMMEVNQLVNLLNIIAEELYIGKFNPDVGVYQIEQKVINGKDKDITDDHLAAYRMSKEEVIYNWMIYLKKVIENYFSNTGKIVEMSRVFQMPFDDQLWIIIRNFLQNLHNLPLWKDRSMANTIFAGKNKYEFWKMIFETGKSPDGAQVLTKPLNYIEMIKPPLNQN